VKSGTVSVFRELTDIGGSLKPVSLTGETGASNCLRILSYNVQGGVDIGRYHHYVTRSWKQVLPHRDSIRNLDRIADILAHYDLVALQEVDAGSLRSGFVNQIEYLAHRAEFPYWYEQVNRSIGKFAQYSNGLLSRVRPACVTEHRLPGLPGRGAILVEFGTGTDVLAVCSLHLALGRRARNRQLDYVGEMISGFEHVIVIGDFNCRPDARELRGLMRAQGLREPACDLHTFPSWRPARNIDHILVSSTLHVKRAKTLDYPLSDHLPICMEVELPKRIRLAA
jgi:endonuclease/exonuclease/phosphatase family metal-dependent hydrolase